MWPASALPSRFRQFLLALSYGITAILNAQSDRFAVHEGEVYDRLTSLTWQRCSAGQQWTNGHCAGPIKMFTWDQARRMDAEGWRLPNKEELASLVDQDRKAKHIIPKIDGFAFPDLPAGTPLHYWSSTPTPCSDDPTGCAYYVSFTSRGPEDVSLMPHSFPLPVRLVRTGASPKDASSAPGGLPPGQTNALNNRFMITAQEALDRKTGLVWQRCEAVKHLEENVGCVGNTRLYTVREALQLGGNGWRLPTVEELKTLLDKQQVGGRALIDEAVFPDTEGDFYLTSTPYGSQRGDVYCVHFAVGGIPSNCGGENRYRVRMVRKGGN